MEDRDEGIVAWLTLTSRSLLPAILVHAAIDLRVAVLPERAAFLHAGTRPQERRGLSANGWTTFRPFRQIWQDARSVG